MPTTLFPMHLLKTGLEFKFLGESEKCKDCKLRTICVENLKPDKWYKIVKIKDIIHTCQAYNLEMRVVEVEEVEPLVVYEGDSISVKETIKPTKIMCNNEKCPYFFLCQNLEFSEKDKLEVVKIERDLPCPLNRKLKLVRVKKKRPLF